MAARSYANSLNLAPSPAEAVQGTPVDFAANLAAETLGVDESWAKDMFVPQVEAAGGLLVLRIGSEQDVTVGVTVGADDSAGETLTPFRVIDGHDALTTRGGEVVPETSVWAGMYNNRSPEWWNRRLPKSEQGIQIVKDPLVILSLSGLRGERKNWGEQRQKLVDLSHAESTTKTATVGAAILDWVQADSGLIVLGRKQEVNRLDEETVTRFPQHEQDRTVFGDAFGPRADVYGGRAELGGSSGGRYPDGGFRSVVGLRKQS